MGNLPIEGLAQQGGFCQNPPNWGGLWMAAREFRWQLSERQWAYLTWLVQNTGLGRTEKDVAAFLLNQKIQEMRLGNYREPNPEDAILNGSNPSTEAENGG